MCLLCKSSFEAGKLRREGMGDIGMAVLLGQVSSACDGCFLSGVGFLYSM